MGSTIDKVISEINQNDESLDSEEISTRVENSLRENSGINANTTILSVWRLNGRLIKNFSSGHSTSLEIDYGSFGYLGAQAILQSKFLIEASLLSLSKKYQFKSAKSRK